MSQLAVTIPRTYFSSSFLTLFLSSCPFHCYLMPFCKILTETSALADLEDSILMFFHRHHAERVSALQGLFEADLQEN